MKMTEERLKQLRDDAFVLQEKYLEELCGEGEAETPLQKRFAFFLWEIDETRRALWKKTEHRKISS